MHGNLNWDDPGQRRYLYRLAHTITSGTDVDDAVQDIVLKIMEERQRDPRLAAQTPAYQYTRGKLRAIDARRRNGEYREQNHQSLDESEASGLNILDYSRITEPADVAALTHILYAQVRSAIDELAANDPRPERGNYKRAIIILRFYYDLPLRQIATLLGINASTCFTWSSAAMRELKVALAPHYEE